MITFKKIINAIQKWFWDVLGARQCLRYFEKEDRFRRLAGQFLTLITIILGIVYLIWHWRHINWDACYYSFTFFIAESVGLILFMFFAFNAWFLRYHAPEGVSGGKFFSVDVFIPVAGESVDLLRKTIEAAVNIDFKDKKVYVLDDKGDEEYKKIAEVYKCGYFARDDRRDAKAGNLNYAFQRTEGDLILVLDADQIPQPQIIKVLIGYFKIPKIAFVQTKQNFHVPIGDPFGNSDRIFYNVMQSGKDNDNSAFSCGSGVIYRREALQSIGGFSTWNLVEDVHTSMLLHERGWRSIYYNHALTIGTAPADIYGVYRQRRQWAADSLRILFWDNPFFHKNLTLKQKFQYFHLGFVYLVAAFIMPFFFITPILALLTQKFVLTATVPVYAIHRFPYFVAMSLAYGILNYPTLYMRAFQMWTGLFPVFIQATWIALCSRKKKPSYRVNIKPSGNVRVKKPWLAVFPQLGIIILSFFTMIYAFINGCASWDFYLLNVVWICWASWTMSGICFAAMKKYKWPKEEPFQQEKSPSFFSRTKELIATVFITVCLTLFFTTVDSERINQYMNHLRRGILAAINLDKPLTQIEKTLPKKEEPRKSDMKTKIDYPTESATVLPIMEAKKGCAGEQCWVIHVFSVRDQKDADVLKAQLTTAGYPTYTIPAKVRSESWIRVRIGIFNSKDEAKKVGDKMQKTGVIPDKPCWITKISSKEKEAIFGN
jgi:cellulose synthase (UDP-forming)